MGDMLQEWGIERLIESFREENLTSVDMLESYVRWYLDVRVRCDMMKLRLKLSSFESDQPLKVHHVTSFVKLVSEWCKFNILAYTINESDITLNVPMEEY